MYQEFFIHLLQFCLASTARGQVKIPMQMLQEALLHHSKVSPHFPKCITLMFQVAILALLSNKGQLTDLHNQCLEINVNFTKQFWLY